MSYWAWVTVPPGDVQVMERPENWVTSSTVVPESVNLISPAPYPRSATPISSIASLAFIASTKPDLTSAIVYSSPASSTASKVTVVPAIVAEKISPALKFPDSWRREIAAASIVEFRSPELFIAVANEACASANVSAASASN